jgi:hypothetical protein
MTTAYTSLLGFALPVTGELSGTWGDTVNNGITSLLDSAIAGTTTLSADSDVTLTTTQGSSNTAREAILLWTAGGSATRTITAPAQSKIYTVINASSGTQSIILAGAGPTSGVTIAKGESALCAWNGSDFIKISNTAGPGTFTNLTVTGNTSLGDADTDTITQAASYVTGTQLKSAKTATNTLSLAAYDVDGTAYTNLITLTAGNTPTLALTSTGVGTINNMSIGATTASTGAFTTLSANSTVTLSGGTENGVAYLNGSKVLTTGSALVFDGTNLGVGTASPSTYSAYTKLSVLNGIAIATNTTDGGVLIGATTTGTELAYLSMGRAYNLGSTGEIVLATNGAKPILFGTSNTERMRITDTSLYTASGINVGIGTTTPSLENGNGLVVYNSSVPRVAFRNSTTGTTAFDGTDLALVNSDFYIFNRESGGILLGTGGTVHARIDSSGNLLVAAGYISATNTSNTTVATGGFDASTSWSLKVANASTTAGTGAGIYFVGGGNSESWIGNLYESSGVGALSFQTRVSGTRAERMRIDSSGNLLVGTTSGTAKIAVESSANFVGQSILATNASYTSNVLNIEASRNTTDASYNFIAAAVAGVAYRFYVRDSGNVVNTNNSYAGISDVKLKENIVDATPKLAALMQVKIRQFNFKNDQTHKQIGVIAQELEQVFPGMIDEALDRDAEGNDLGTVTKSVKYSVFVPMLIKAMQEQQALITQLTARITALESA